MYFSNVAHSTLPSTCLLLLPAEIFPLHQLVLARWSVWCVGVTSFSLTLLLLIPLILLPLHCISFTCILFLVLLKSIISLVCLSECVVSESEFPSSNSCYSFALLPLTLIPSNRLFHSPASWKFSISICVYISKLSTQGLFYTYFYPIPPLLASSQCTLPSYLYPSWKALR